MNNATPPTGYYSLVGAINQANADSTSGIADTISLAANSTYTFTATNNTTNGANVLPVITATSLTISGNGSTLNAASFGRLFDVASGAGVTIGNLTLTGGSETGATAQGGAVFNNGGNVTLKTDVVGGNQVVGGANQNGQGGAIYSNGGTLTLVKDIIGKKVTNYYNASFALTKHSTFGNSNKAAGGVGGSGQGAGLYVTGGTVNVSSCTFGANYATGGSAPTGGTGGSGQGGAIYSNVASLDLNKSFIGIKVTHHLNSSNVQTKQTSIGVANSIKGGNGGGSVQGIGLFVSGGTVKVTNCSISGNGGFAGNGVAGGAGGDALGGGIYSSGATLTVSGGSLENNFLISGNGGTGAAGTVNHINGGAGGAGGTAQGAGIYAQGGSLTVTNGAILSSLGDLAGAGGVGGAAYTGGVGGAGGAGGAAEGGSIYAANLTSLLVNGSSQLKLNTIMAGAGGVGVAGGVGGQGGLAAGGAVFATQTAVQINGGAVLNSNQLNAGAGGTGGAGAAGGAGGAAQGGGLYSDGGSVSLTGSAQFNLNKLSSGAGGFGGAGVAGTLNGGVGGNSGAVEGGGVYAVGGKVTMSTVQVQQNSIVANVAGKGGNGASSAAVNGVGGAGGAGGVGGAQIGGGLYVSGSNLTVSITSVSLSYNLEGPTAANGGAGGAGGAAANGTGGAGGAAGNDGNTEGGGAAFFGSNTVTLNGITSVSNVIIGDTPGYGGSGGVGLVGGAGGNAGNAGVVQGGGIFAGGGTVTINGGSVIENNEASGQTGGKGGRAGKSTNNTAKTVVHIGTGGAGSGSQGGGVAATGATVTLDNATISANYSVGGEGGTGGAYTNYEKTNLSLYNSGVNGAGGFAQGGGLYASNGSLTIQNGTTITKNVAQGAFGGPTQNYAQLQSAGFSPVIAAPGVAQGAGAAIVNMTSAVTFTNSTIDSNVLETTDGGNGDPNASNNTPVYGVYPLNGANGLNNGTAQGAGLFVQNSTFNGTSATITNNGIRVGDGGNGATPPSTNTKVHTGGNGGNGGGVNTAQGGGLYATGSTITLTSSTLVGNTLSVDNGGNAGVGNSAKPNGLAGSGGSGGIGEGAGLYADSSSTVTMLSSSVSNNTATIGFGGNGAPGGAGGAGGNDGSGLGGGVYVNGTSTLKVTDSTLASNIIKVDFGGNGSGSGAGGAGGVGTSATTSGTAQGGGLFAGASTLTLINDTLAANTLDVAFGGNGGAAGVGGAGGVNNGVGQGGGLYLAGGSATVINDTVADNTLAVNQGGTGTTAGTSGSAYTAQAGGLYDNPNSTDAVTLENTIVALDTVFSSPNDILGTIASSDHDFIGNGSGATFTSSTGDQIGTSTSPLNPNLGPLANYGGATLTMLPNSGSAVLGVGDTGALTAIATAENTTSTNATDERGYARSVGGKIDIGADEDQLGLSISGTVTPSNVQAGDDITYTFTVTNPNTFSVSGLTLTDVLPSNTTFVSLAPPPSGWTTSTPTAGTTGTVSATTASLAASSSATFTLTVKVNSTVASGTTIQNTASIATTQTGLQVSNSSVTLSTTVGTPVNIITSEVAIFRSPIIPDFDDGQGSYLQLLLLVNKTRTTITGPVALVLTNLTSGVTLTNASGTYNGSPYINIVSSNGSWKPGWWNLLFVTLEFSDPSGVPITYTPEIVQGL